MMSLAHRLRAARLYLCTDARERQGDLADFLRGGVRGRGGRRPDPAEGHGPRRRARRAGGRPAAPPPAPPGRSSASTTRPRVAQAFAADMLHLGQTDGSARRARRSLHRWALIGRSTHTPDQVDAGARRTRTSTTSPSGPCTRPRPSPTTSPSASTSSGTPPGSRRSPTSASKPWFAIGGLDARNLDEVHRGRSPAGGRRPGHHRGVRPRGRRPRPQGPAAARPGRTTRRSPSYALRSAALGT